MFLIFNLNNFTKSVLSPTPVSAISRLFLLEHIDFLKMAILLISRHFILTAFSTDGERSKSLLESNLDEAVNISNQPRGGLEASCFLVSPSRIGWIHLNIDYLQFRKLSRPSDRIVNSPA